MTRTRHLLALTLGAASFVVGISGCGSSGALSSADAATIQLRHDMQALAAAAAAHDTAAEQDALTIMKTDTLRASSTHAIDATTLARIAASIAKVQTDLTTATSTPTPSATPTAASPSTPPTTPTSRKPKGHGKGQGGGD